MGKVTAGGFVKEHNSEEKLLTGLAKNRNIPFLKMIFNFRTIEHRPLGATALVVLRVV